MALNIVQLAPHRIPTKISASTFSLTLLLVLSLSLVGLYAILHRHDSQSSSSSATPLEQRPSYFHQVFVESASNNTISSFLRSLTLRPHVAGTPNAVKTRDHVLQELRKLSPNAHVVEYQPLLSYPSYRSLALRFPNGTTQSLSLDEEKLSWDAAITPPYHAYAPSGSVVGAAVYANYGRKEDYARLEEMGVSVRGCVVIARNGDVFRGKVVKDAEAEGAVGVLLYTGRNRYESARERDASAASERLFFPRDGIERGTVIGGERLGDPLTPGWGAVKGEERLGLRDKRVADRFPTIPSLPISFDNARVILQALEGPELPIDWRDDAILFHNQNHHLQVNVGSGPLLVNLTYVENQTTAVIGNVFATIPGSLEPDRFVLLGNHRDAWTYGAVDPNSGTALLLEIARRFKILLNQGWKPRRSITLCSWDAEEFGMIGSTEWVEENLDILVSNAVAYLNVDCAVQGPGFYTAASPQLDKLIIEITKQINDPDSGHGTVYQSWSASDRGAKIGRLSGVDSDFAAFLQHGGVPSADLFYGKDFPVYHTAYDSYEWMKEFGDPQFLRHVAVSGIWGLLALHLADDSILPFDYHYYAVQLEEHSKALKAILDGNISLRPLTGAVEELSDVATKAAEEVKELIKCSVEVGCDLRRRSFNDRLMLAEKGFLDVEGLKDREWFKHLVYGPSGSSESKLDFFPAIMDAVTKSGTLGKEDGRMLVQHEVWRVSRAIHRAARVLRGGLT